MGVGEDCAAGEGAVKTVLVGIGRVMVGLAVGESEVMRTWGVGKKEGSHATNIQVSRVNIQTNLKKDL